MDVSELERAINESGFPLQLGVKQLVVGNPHWRTILSEHPWTDPLSSDEKFIDFVLQQGQDYPVRLVVECKRARETEWVFLREPSTRSGRDNRLNVRSRVAVRRGGGVIDEWIDLPFTKGSPEANYCVIRKNGQRSQELLERTAAEVVRATESLAQQEVAIFQRSRNLPDPTSTLTRVYVPMIITTAKMSICDAEYDSLELDSGEVRNPTSFESPFVRFTKSLGSLETSRSNAKSIEEFSKQSERSVIVVQATNFLHFLETFQMSRHMPEGIRAALF